MLSKKLSNRANWSNILSQRGYSFYNLVILVKSEPSGNFWIFKTQLILTKSRLELFSLNKSVRSGPQARKTSDWGFMRSKIQSPSRVKKIITPAGSFLNRMIASFAPRRPTRSLRLENGGLWSSFRTLGVPMFYVLVFLTIVRGFCQKTCLSSVKISFVKRTR